MIFVGNRKVVWEGRPVRGDPIPMGMRKEKDMTRYSC
jgi:hypothetical protein